MTNMLFNVLSFVIRPLGYIMIAYGEYSHKLKWIAFGHYIASSGKRLRVKQTWAIESITNDLNSDYMCHYSGKANWHEFSSWHNPDIYYTFGKAKWRDCRLYDIYQFYETCDYAHIHWKNCNCNKKWSFYAAIDFRLLNGIYNKFLRELKYVSWNYDGKYFTISITHFSFFSMTISDEIFSKLGKPFAITVVLPEVK